jgi:SAM-dependent methyltransferase
MDGRGATAKNRRERFAGVRIHVTRCPQTLPWQGSDGSNDPGQAGFRAITGNGGMAVDVIAHFKAAQRAGWVHFAPLQTFTTEPAARLVRFAGVRPGDRVLDVACGTGVVAVTAAVRGAAVTGLDLTPELLDVARDNARIAAVEIAWREGDAENLPFAPNSFDVVISQFGHMFAPRPDTVTAQMLKVLKPGGTIAFSTWPPELFIGRLFALTAGYMPPPAPGVAPPPQWGDPNVIRGRLGTYVDDLRFDRATMVVPTLSARHQREAFERTAGPVVTLVEMLTATDPQRLQAYRAECEALVAEYLQDNVLRQGYLMARATKAR